MAERERLRQSLPADAGGGDLLKTEELNIEPIRIGDPARSSLWAAWSPVRGHVGSIARAINLANAQPNGQGLALVNPISLGCG